MKPPSFTSSHKSFKPTFISLTWRFSTVIWNLKMSSGKITHGKSLILDFAARSNTNFIKAISMLALLFTCLWKVSSKISTPTNLTFIPSVSWPTKCSQDPRLGGAPLKENSSTSWKIKPSLFLNLKISTWLNSCISRFKWMFKKGLISKASNTFTKRSKTNKFSFKNSINWATIWKSSNRAEASLQPNPSLILHMELWPLPKPPSPHLWILELKPDK